jgi:hypothetical protein
VATRTKTTPRLLTHREVAGLISIDTETLREWVAAGEWPEPLAVIRTTWFFPAELIECFLRTGAWPEGTRFKPGVGKGRDPGAAVRP